MQKRIHQNLVAVFFLESSTKTEETKKEKMLSPGKKLLANSGVKWNSIDVAMKEAAET